MAITLTDEMLEILQGLEKAEAKMFLKGIQLAQDQPRMAQDQPGRETAASREPAVPPAPIPNPAQTAPLAKSPRVRASSANNRGAYADVLRLLFTGPATYNQLQEASRYSRQVILRVISQGQRQGNIVPLPPGQEGWQLTPQGRHIAAVFVRNPGMRLLHAQARLAIAKENQ